MNRIVLLVIPLLVSPVACHRGAGPWFEHLPEFTCPRDPPEEYGQPSAPRPLEVDLPALPFPRAQRPCPDLPGGAPESVGTATDGVLCGGARLEPDDGKPWILLPATRARGTACGSTRLVEAIERAAADLVAKHPGVRLPVGNVARCGGGDLPWSVSHNTGRDADLYFVMQAEDGRQHLPPKVTPIDTRALTIDDGAARYAFAVDANLDVVLSLARAPEVDVQWIFVANPLRRVLLDRARERKVPARDLDRLGEILHQPRGALPHDDHFHVRVRCTAAERRTGCLDLPRTAGETAGPGDEPVRALLARVKKGPDRTDALELLLALGARGVLPAALEAWPRLDDDGKLVVLALGARDPGDTRSHARLATLLDKESSPRVVRHGIDLAFRRLGEESGLERLLGWARRGQVFDGRGDPFYTFRPDCVVVETCATHGSLALLLRLVDAKPRACGDRADLWEHTLRWITGYPPDVFERVQRGLHRMSLADVRLRALKERGYLTSLRPSDDELLAAAGASEADVAYGACRLLQSRLGRDPAACLRDPPGRLEMLRRALRR